MPSATLASLTNTVVTTLLALFAAGLLCVAYGTLVEHGWYRRADYRLPILPADARPLTILHLSDLHVLRREQRKARFIASLPQPDITIATGDLVGEPAGVEAAVEALRPVRGRLASYFVLGSNDLFAPRPLNPAAYFFPQRRRRPGHPGRARELVGLLEADGWTHMDNVKTTLSNDGVRLEIVGLGDAHIYRHDLRVAPRTDPDALGVAIAHSPDPAPELAALGYRLIVSGHTHGGQVRLPLVGALVTNSQMPRKLGMGLSRLGPALMHISPGIGTSKYAPFRFMCRPEATILTLVPAAMEAEQREARADRVRS